MRGRALLLGLAGCWGTLAGCSDPAAREIPELENPEPAAATNQPAYVEVDHILIGVANPKLDGVTRSAREARAVAYEILADLANGSDWDRLKDIHTDDRRPTGELGGPYAMANFGVIVRSRDETPRKKMVKGFGDVSFGLGVGEIGIADYDPDDCKWGYHIVKRVK